MTTHPVYSANEDIQTKGPVKIDVSTRDSYESSVTSVLGFAKKDVPNLDYYYLISGFTLSGMSQEKLDGIYERFNQARHFWTLARIDSIMAAIYSEVEDFRKKTVEERIQIIEQYSQRLFEQFYPTLNIDEVKGKEPSRFFTVGEKKSSNLQKGVLTWVQRAQQKILSMAPKLVSSPQERDHLVLDVSNISTPAFFDIKTENPIRIVGINNPNVWIFDLKNKVINKEEILKQSRGVRFFNTRTLKHGEGTVHPLQVFAYSNEPRWMSLFEGSLFLEDYRMIDRSTWDSTKEAINGVIRSIAEKFIISKEARIKLDSVYRQNPGTLRSKYRTAIVAYAIRRVNDSEGNALIGLGFPSEYSTYRADARGYGSHGDIFSAEKHTSLMHLLAAVSNRTEKLAQLLADIKSGRRVLSGEERSFLRVRISHGPDIFESRIVADKQGSSSHSLGWAAQLEFAGRYSDVGDHRAIGSGYSFAAKRLLESYQESMEEVNTLLKKILRADHSSRSARANSCRRYFAAQSL